MTDRTYIELTSVLRKYYDKVHKTRTFLSHGPHGEDRGTFTHLPGSKRSHLPRSSVEETSRLGPWNVKSSMSGSERVRNACGKDRLLSSVATDETNRLPYDDLFAASVRAPTALIDQPNLAERPLVQSTASGSVQALKYTSARTPYSANSQIFAFKITILLVLLEFTSHEENRRHTDESSVNLSFDSTSVAVQRVPTFG